MVVNGFFMGLSALASGALFAFSNVGFEKWWFAFICFGPLLVVIDQTRPSVRRAFVLGSLMGAAVYLVGYTWLLALGGDFIAGSATSIYAMWLGYGFVVALHFGVMFGLYQWLRRRHVKTWTAFALALVLVESLQFNLFPFYLGASLVHAPFLPHAADLGGVYLLSAVLAVINAAAAGAVRRFFASNFEGVAHVLLVLIGFGSLWVYGLSAELHITKEMARALPEQTLRVGLIQSSTNAENVIEAPVGNNRIREHHKYLELSRTLVSGEAPDLLVWREASYGVGLLGEYPLDAALVRQELRLPILFGGTRIETGTGQKTSSNSVFLINQQGMINDSYSKTKLIPFAETLPLAKENDWYKDAVQSVFTAHQNFSPGTRLNTLTLGAHRLATPICYETVMPGLVRRLVRQRGGVGPLESSADFIVSISNDSWFGHSQEPQIHLAMARLRAIEHRKWFVRSANNGISAVINPLGQTVTEIGLGVEGARVTEISARSQPTLFTQYGNWVLLVLILLVGIEIFSRGWLLRAVNKLKGPVNLTI